MAPEIHEDAPVNNAGAGNVRGIAPGEDPPGELPLFDKDGNKRKRREKRIKTFKEYFSERTDEC